MSDPREPHVAVVISTYNRPEYLRKALQSVLAQTYGSFDVLVWNDGGIDMEPLVPELADTRVRYHHSAANLGVGQAVGHALRAADGELIAHLDDDDEWAADYLRTLAGLLAEQPSATLAFCDHWITDEHGKENVEWTDANSRQWGRLRLAAGLHRPAHEIAFARTIPVASAAVIRRAALDLDDYPEQIGYAHDLWVSYLATRGGGGVVYEPRRLVRKARHPAQLGRSVASVADLRDLTIVYDRYAKVPAEEPFSRQARKSLAEACANLAVAQLREGEDTVEARRIARQGLRVEPSLRGTVAASIAHLPGETGRGAAQALSSGVELWRRRTRVATSGHGA